MQYQLDALIDGIPVQMIQGQPSTMIQGLSDDSRQVCPGDLFIARGGTAEHGQKYIQQATQQGAAAVVLLHGQNPSAQNEILGKIAKRFYGDPATKLKIIGITGTNGKTTTAYILKYLIESYNKKCGLLGTVCIDDGKKVYPAHLTTPGTLELYRWLNQMAGQGCKAAVMEVSSHALDQGRHAGLKFAASVFTNLTGDHLDYHHDMATYAQAKSLLFQALLPSGLAVVNGRDAHSALMASQSAGVLVQTWVGTAAERQMRAPLTPDVEKIRAKADEQAEALDAPAVMGQVVSGVILEMDAAASQVLIEMGHTGFTCQLPLVGVFNVSNVLQAMVACGCVVELDGRIGEILAGCPSVPGRLERVAVQGVPGPTVFVDYAHTHDALENVLQAVGQTVGKALGYAVGDRVSDDDFFQQAPAPVTSDFDQSSEDVGGDDEDALEVPLDVTKQERAKLWVVFGCGGDRDKTKRAKMGRVAKSLADVVVVTSDNPRSEDPEEIIRQICQGVCDRELAPNTAWQAALAKQAQEGDQTTHLRVITDRSQAIAYAIANASAGDVVVIAGKGHEDYQILGQQRIDFDDRIHARRALANRRLSDEKNN